MANLKISEIKAKTFTRMNYKGLTIEQLRKGAKILSLDLRYKESWAFLFQLLGESGQAPSYFF